jgi:superfamily II DNA or RNA helicase
MLDVFSFFSLYYDYFFFSFLDFFWIRKMHINNQGCLGGTRFDTRALQAKPNMSSSSSSSSFSSSPKSCLSMRGYVIPKACLDARDYEALKKDLTVKAFTNVDMGAEKVLHVFAENADEICIPKNFGLKHFGLPDEIDLGYGRQIDQRMEFKGALRPEQMAPVEGYLAAANDPMKMGGIINLSCGQGKTVCALYIISKIGRKALIVVHKEFLLNQWKERIAEFLPSARVGMFKGKTQDLEDKDIVIGTLQSLSMKDFDTSIFSDIGLMCVDECHRTGAEVFSMLYRKLTTRYTLGLSATLERKDGLSKVFKWHIGDVVYKCQKRQDDVVVRMCQFHHENITYRKERTMYNGQINISKMINCLCDFEPRTKYIVEVLIDTLKQDPGRKVLLLSDRRAHLQSFVTELTSRDITCGLYYGGLKETVLKESEKAQVLLATYAFCAEGLDVPKLDTLILASPKSDVVQASGRILREKADQRLHVPIIIDVVDDFSIFGAQAKKRERYYRTQKYRVDRV